MSTPDPSEDPSIAKRLSEAEWTEAKTLFELGQATKTDLARKYGVSRQAIATGLEKRGAVYGAKSKVIADATINAQKTDADKKVEAIQVMREKQRKQIEMVQALASKAIMDSIKANEPIARKKDEIQTLKGLMSIFAAGRAELWEIYGLNDDKDAGEELPEFAVSEYTPDEIDQINRKQFGDITPDDVLQRLEQETEQATGGDPLDDLLGEDEPS